MSSHEKLVLLLNRIRPLCVRLKNTLWMEVIWILGWRYLKKLNLRPKGISSKSPLEVPDVLFSWLKASPLVANSVQF